MFPRLKDDEILVLQTIAAEEDLESLDLAADRIGSIERALDRQLLVVDGMVTEFGNKLLANLPEAPTDGEEEEEVDDDTSDEETSSEEEETVDE